MNQQLPEFRYDGVHCQLAVERPAPGIIVVRLAGWDTGDFGDLPMQELASDLAQPP